MLFTAAPQAADDGCLGTPPALHAPSVTSGTVSLAGELGQDLIAAQPVGAAAEPRQGGSSDGCACIQCTRHAAVQLPLYATAFPGSCARYLDYDHVFMSCTDRSDGSTVTGHAAETFTRTSVTSCLRTADESFEGSYAPEVLTDPGSIW